MKKGFMYVIIIYFILVAGLLQAQTVTELQNNYSGTINWNGSNGTLTFTSTGKINFNKQNYKNAYWDVPQDVKKIIINANVRVTGAFHTKNNCTIEGKNRKTSVVFGTDEQRWADNRNLDEWEYCQFQNRGGVLTVKNLTGLNPFAYFIRGWGKVCHAKSCDFIDDRGGWYNHSDGFSGGHGSTVDDCYFETGDDVIKCYFDITVTNTTIKMIQNSVPFQFGWGTYQDSRSEMENITITGDWGRGDKCPVFQWKSGSDKKIFVMSGCRIENPKAHIFELQSSGTLDLDISDALIDLKGYGTSSFPGTRIICDTTEQTNYYECLNTDIHPTDNKQTKTVPLAIYPNTVQGRIRIELSGIETEGKLVIHNIQGRTVYSATIKDDQSIIINKRLKAGVYLVRFYTEGTAVSRAFIKCN